MPINQGYEVGTKYGTVQITPTEATHLYVTNDLDSQPSRASIIVNNIALADVSAHLYLWKDGKWHIGPEEKQEWERNKHMWAKRDLKTEASTSQKQKLAEEFELVVNMWASMNQLAINKAQIKRLEMDKEQLRADIAGIEDNLREKREELNSLYLKLADLLKNCPDTEAVA